MLRTAWNASRGWANRARVLEWLAGRWASAAALCVALAVLCGATPWLIIVLPNSYPWIIGGSWLACAVAAASAAAAYFCATTAAHTRADWLQARATAESVSSECYRFAGDFPVADATAFQKRVALLERQAIEKGLLRLDGPTPSSTDEREPAADMTKNWYKTYRILDQIKYCRQARAEDEAIAIRLWWIALASGLTAVALVASGVFFIWLFGLGAIVVGLAAAPLLAAVTPAFACFVTSKRANDRRRNISRYAILQSGLEHILGLDESAPASLADLVDRTERLLATEYTTAQPQAPTEQTQPLPDESAPVRPAEAATSEDGPESKTVPAQETQPELQPRPAPAQEQVPVTPSLPTLNVGLTFTAEDQPVAEALRNVLLNLDRKIQVLMESEFPIGTRWQDKITSMLDNVDILIPTSTITMQSYSGGSTGFEIGYFFQSLRTVPKMRDFPDQDRRIIIFKVFAAAPVGGSQNQDERGKSLEGFHEIRVNIDTTVPPASQEFEQQNKRNTEVISLFLREILRIVTADEYGESRFSLELPRLALDLCRKLFDVMQAKQTESHREVERGREERAIAEERYLERNLKDVFIVQTVPIRLTQTPTRYRTPHRSEARAPASNFWFRTD